MTEPWSDAYVERRMREHKAWQEREATRLANNIMIEIALDRKRREKAREETERDR